MRSPRTFRVLSAPLVAAALALFRPCHADPESSLGINLWFHMDWGTDWAFVDKMKSCRGWWEQPLDRSVWNSGAPLTAAPGIRVVRGDVLVTGPAAPAALALFSLGGRLMGGLAGSPGTVVGGRLPGQAAPGTYLVRAGASAAGLTVADR